MTWSYSGDPSENEKNEVRFLVGDTNIDEKLVEDEEIAYALAKEGSPMRAAVRVARAIAAHFARTVEKQVGDLKIKAGDRYKQYLELVESLEREAAGSIPGAAPFAGGISNAAKSTQESDSDRASPYFKRDMQNNVDSNLDNDLINN